MDTRLLSRISFAASSNSHNRFQMNESNLRLISLIAILFGHKFSPLINYRIPLENQLASRGEVVWIVRYEETEPGWEDDEEEEESLLSVLHPRVRRNDQWRTKPGAISEFDRRCNRVVCASSRARDRVIDRPFPEDRGRNPSSSAPKWSYFDLGFDRLHSTRHRPARRVLPAIEKLTVGNAS